MDRIVFARVRFLRQAVKVDLLRKEKSTVRTQRRFTAESKAKITARGDPGHRTVVKLATEDSVVIGFC